MEQNSQFNMQEIMRLAASPAGQQLIALLQQQNSAALHSAIASASAGNYEHAKSALGSMLDSPEARTLLQQLGR